MSDWKSGEFEVNGLKIWGLIFKKYFKKIEGENVTQKNHPQWNGENDVFLNDLKQKIKVDIYGEFEVNSMQIWGFDFKKYLLKFKGENVTRKTHLFFTRANECLPGDMSWKSWV